ncbi:hypothetical protein I5F10_04165 [Proteus mirabilis]|nr:hypothetical protein [Proteus mirabilis]MBG6047382.1 hypothetical protein [Proteus mirabilis]
MDNIIILITVIIFIMLLSISLSWFYIKYTLGLFYRSIGYFYRSLCFLTLLSVATFLYHGFYNHICFLLKEQVAYSNFGHIEIYKKENKNNIENKNSYLEITNAEEIIDLLTKNVELSEKIQIISPQIIFLGAVENLINKKIMFFWGLAIEPQLLLSIGAYDLTTLGSELSNIRKTEITVDKTMASSININYGDWVNVIFVNHENEKIVLPTYVRGVFKTQIKAYPYATIKIPLETIQDLKKSKNVSRINILLKNSYYIDSVISTIEKINKEKALNLKIVSAMERQDYIVSIMTFFNWSIIFLYSVITVFSYLIIKKIVVISIKRSISDIIEFNKIGIWRGSFSRLFILLAIFIVIAISISILLIGNLLSWLINMRQINIKISDDNSYPIMISWLWQYDVMLKIPLLLLFSAITASCVSTFKISHYLNKFKK